MFALDADGHPARPGRIARNLQAKMFRSAAPIGKLDVQLVYLPRPGMLAPRNG